MVLVENLKVGSVLPKGNADGIKHYQLNGHEFEQPPGDSEGAGSLGCCSPWGHKELGTT